MIWPGLNTEEKNPCRMSTETAPIRRVSTGDVGKGLQKRRESGPFGDIVSLRGEAKD